MPGKHRAADPKAAAWEAADALRDTEQEWQGASTYPYDVDAIWELFQKLTCPVTCVGYVNSEGWHQLCQRRAQAAMKALDLPAPDIDPIPARDNEEWDY